MKVLVVGGAGFIGSHVADHLLAKGVDTHVLDNFSTGLKENLPQGITLHTGDICDIDFVRAVLTTDFDSIIYLAAQVSVPRSIEAPSLSVYANVYGFSVMAETLKEKGFTGKIIYASSSAVYGDEGISPLTEAYRAKAPLSPYALEKQMNEDMAALYQRLYQFKTLGLRFFNVYGPRQQPDNGYAGVISVFAHKILANETITVYGDGQQSRDFVYVEDVAQVIVHALQHPMQGIMNVGTGSSSSLLKLIECIAQQTAYKPQVNFAPKRPGDIAHSVADVSLLKEKFGPDFCQTSLDDGLKVLLQLI